MYPLFFRRPGKKWSPARARQISRAVKANRHPNQMHASSNLPSMRTKKWVHYIVITLYMYLLCDLWLRDCSYPDYSVESSRIRITHSELSLVDPNALLLLLLLLLRVRVRINQWQLRVCNSNSQALNGIVGVWWIFTDKNRLVIAEDDVCYRKFTELNESVVFLPIRCVI
jgi:hypothetical protein